jgi:hypothetical protein
MNTVEDRLRALLEEAAPQVAGVTIQGIERGARRRHRRFTTALVVGAAATVLVVAAGIFGSLGTASPPTKAPPASPPSSSVSSDGSKGEYTQTAAWRDVGEQIRAARRANPRLTAVIPVQLSDPIDVTGPGIYVMEIGPVPAATQDGDIAMTLPPDMSDHFVLQGSPLHGLTFVHRASGTFVQVHLMIGQFRSPYHHLTAWFQ